VRGLVRYRRSEGLATPPHKPSTKPSHRAVKQHPRALL